MRSPVKKPCCGIAVKLHDFALEFVTQEVGKYLTVTRATMPEKNARGGWPNPPDRGRTDISEHLADSLQSLYGYHHLGELSLACSAHVCADEAHAKFIRAFRFVEQASLWAMLHFVDPRLAEVSSYDCRDISELIDEVHLHRGRGEIVLPFMHRDDRLIPVFKGKISTI
jgi:hypothetical protein